MAVVYRARQLSLQRPVALKVMSDDLARDPDARRRFVQEGVLAARVSHPNLVGVLEVGESKGKLFLCVVTSWLLDLTAEALLRWPDLAEFAGRVSDSGEGRWTAKAAIDEGVPAQVLTAALQDRSISSGIGPGPA